MIAVTLAQQLRDAGLVWRPVPFDFFALPESMMEEEVFVVSDQAAFLQLYNGYPVVAFHGSTEWALDYVLLNEVVWMPTETQLREQIEQRIAADAPFIVKREAIGYSCDIGTHNLAAEDAATALAQVLLQLLREDTRPIDDR